MDFSKIFVRDGKVVVGNSVDKCEAGKHIFSAGPSRACDCGMHQNFFVAESEGLSQEPVAVKKHLSLYVGGKQ